MNELKISFRYAKGLLLCALETKSFDTVLADIERIERASQTIPEFLSDLDKEDVPAYERKRLATEICKSIGICDLVINLINLLVDRNRITLFPYIAITYRDLVDNIKNNKRVLIKIADKKQESVALEYVEKIMEENLGCKISCESKVDKNIIGGSVIQIGDLICDMSVSTKIDQVIEDIKRGIYGYQTG